MYWTGQVESGPATGPRCHQWAKVTAQVTVQVQVKITAQVTMQVTAQVTMQVTVQGGLRPKDPVSWSLAQA
jgi:hypothetical protein